MLAGKTLLAYTNSFCPNDCKKNDKIITILKANMSSPELWLKKFFWWNKS